MVATVLFHFPLAGRSAQSLVTIPPVEGKSADKPASLHPGRLKESLPRARHCSQCGGQQTHQHQDGDMHSSERWVWLGGSGLRRQGREQTPGRENEENRKGCPVVVQACRGLGPPRAPVGREEGPLSNRTAGQGELLAFYSGQTGSNLSLKEIILQ